MLLSPILIGILNLECAMRPPGNIDAAIPDVIVAMAINPLDRTLARSALYRKVLSVSPEPSTKKNLALVGKDTLNDFIKTFSLLLVKRIKNI
jgi:hypothetical protein